VEFDDARPLLPGLLVFSENGRSSLQELPFPLRDLVGMDVVALGGLDEGLFALDGFQGHLGLERR